MKKISIIFVILILAQASIAQCFEDRHNGNWFDSWISCEASMNPNSARGNGHWIFYDFHHTYTLGASTIWNLNIPGSTENGMNEVVIDYSVDGVTWTEWGNFNFPEAPGISTYEGFQGPDFTGLTAKYMIITALSNHGGDCVGFSELRIGVEDAIISDIPEIEDNGCLDLSVYPNPHSESFTSKILSSCPENISWNLFDVQGRLVKKGTLNQVAEENYLDLDSDGLPAGLYHLVVIQGTARARMPIIKSSL